MNKSYAFPLLILGLSTIALRAADEDRRPRPGPRGPSPLLLVLDADKDGVLSADEIANAATALKALDANGDGQLDRSEMMPPPPAGAPAAP